jgi:hypothetical protein
MQTVSVPESYKTWLLISSADCQLKKRTAAEAKRNLSKPVYFVKNPVHLYAEADEPTD